MALYQISVHVDPHGNWIEITWIGGKAETFGWTSPLPSDRPPLFKVTILVWELFISIVDFQRTSFPRLHSESPSLPEQGGFGGPYASVAEMIRGDSNTAGRPQSSMLSLTYVNIVPMTAFSYPICNCKGIHYFSHPGGKERSWASLLLGKCNWLQHIP